MRSAITLAFSVLAACGPTGNSVATDQGSDRTADYSNAVALSDAAALLGRYTSPAPQAGPFAPRDECASIPGANDFRLALAEATVRHDADALVALADPAITLDYGGGSGRKELRARLDSTDADLWSQLEAILALGCVRNETGSLVMPWHFNQDVGTRDPYALAIVIGDKVPLRKQGRADGDVLRVLSWEGVEIVGTDGVLDAFEPVRLADGTEGFVEGGSLRALLDYRLLAEKSEDGWRLTAFVAGD